jgi:probable O-glycosylation ligase (exosortase A-associated)
MPVRDLALTVLVFGLLPVCLARPWLGLVVWFWLSLMNPHRLVWGFAYHLPFAQVVAVVTLAGVLFAKDRGPFLWTRETILLLALWVWFGVTTSVATFPDAAWAQLVRTSKVFLMTLLVVVFFQDRARLRVLLLTVAGSIGFFGLKGGLWAIATGGNYSVLGPGEDTSVSTNNAIGLALNMCLPLFFYLAREERRRWTRGLLYACFFTSIVAVPFTYSRGAVVGLVVVLSMLLLNRHNIHYAAVAVILFGVLAFNFAPEKWTERMHTIWDYQGDSSANARLVSWGVASRLAADHPLTGGGFWSIANLDTFRRYAPEYAKTGFHDAHSIYFGLLGEHGFPGLAVFAAFAACTIASLRRVQRRARNVERLHWAANYAWMLQSSIVGYLATGTFMSVAYFDLAYLLFIVSVLLRVLVDRDVEAHEAAERSATSTTASTRALPRFAWMPLGPHVRGWQPR